MLDCQKCDPTSVFDPIPIYNDDDDDDDEENRHCQLGQTSAPLEGSGKTQTTNSKTKNNMKDLLKMSHIRQKEIVSEIDDESIISANSFISFLFQNKVT